MLVLNAKWVGISGLLMWSDLFIWHTSSYTMSVAKKFAEENPWRWLFFCKIKCMLQ